MYECIVEMHKALAIKRERERRTAANLRQKTWGDDEMTDSPLLLPPPVMKMRM